MFSSGIKVFLLVVSINLSNGQKNYVAHYRPLADSLSAVYGIPASVILGIAIIESSSGQSRNARLLNNHFGIVGKNNLQKTKHIKSKYKQYKTVADSYVDFCRHVSRRKFYLQLRGNPDPYTWIDHLSKSGYSTKPAIWKKRMLETIKRNKLG